jgi:drug/metabolite transporter (DMT)-like permease
VKSPLLLGILAALLAALAWSLNFIVPFVIGDYSIFDIALFRFLISGLIASGYLIIRWNEVRSLTVAGWLMALALGLMGYFVYFQALAGAALYAGPVIAPAFLAVVPVVLGITGNLRQPTIAWRDLAFPCALATTGLLLVNGGSFERASLAQAPSLLLGIPLAVLAAACWVWFGLFNQSAIAKRPQMPAGTWTALIMVGASLGMLAFIPLGLLMHAFAFPRLGLTWNAASCLYIWGVILALTASLGGALAWTYATQRLPVALSAQLITMETVFGTILGLLVRHRWPTLLEAGGMLVLVAGVMITIRIVHRPRSAMAAGVTAPTPADRCADTQL